MDHPRWKCPWYLGADREPGCDPRLWTWPCDPLCRVTLEESYARLQDILRGYGSCLVTYPAAWIPVFLARVAHDVLGDRSSPRSPIPPVFPRRELAKPFRWPEQFGIPVPGDPHRQFNDASYLSNPTNRCYFCKHALFTELTPLARAGICSHRLRGERPVTGITVRAPRPQRSSGPRAAQGGGIVQADIEASARASASRRRTNRSWRA